MNRMGPSLRTVTRTVVVLAALLAAAAVLACSRDDAPTASPTPASPTPEQTASGTPVAGDYRQAVDRWLAYAIRDYRFTLQRRCECPDEWSAPTVVTVRDGIAVSATIESTPAPEGAALTIDDLFGAIAAALNEPVETAVTYDTELGIPLDVQLDLEAIAVDGGLSLTVSDFERLD